MKDHYDFSQSIKNPYLKKLHKPVTIQLDKIDYAHIKEDLPAAMEKVCHEHTPIIITRDGKPPVILMSLEDYQSFEETVYLLRSPKNAQRLLDSITQLESGGGRERELLE